MQPFDIKRIPFINASDQINAFSLRIAAVMIWNSKYIFVQNEGDIKYKHPGGHIQSNESLTEALVREVKEETGLTIKDPNLDNLIFNYTITENKYILIGGYVQIPITETDVNMILKNSPLPSKLLTLEELTDEVTWESEVSPIKHLLVANTHG